MKIAEYKQISTKTVTNTIEVDVCDEFGVVIGVRTETVTKEVPVMGMVYRDMTPEEEAEALKAQAEAEANAEPVLPEIVYITREDFNLLDATKNNTIYYVTEENGTLTMIKGDNK